jgi:glycosyltransferase involved in cell wall biosynthesis
MGKSAAIKTGFQYALEKKFDYVVTIDGDGQHNPDEIPTVLGNVVNNGHDISIGYRTGDSTEMPGWRKVGKRVLDYSTSFGSGGFVTDSQCGFRAFNRKALEAITPRLNGQDFTVESEQLIKAHELGLGVVNTNVTCKYNDLDTSTKNPASHGFSVLRYVIWLVAEKHPLLLIALPGFISVIIGLFFGITTLQYYNKMHVFLISYAILVSILLIIGTLAMFMGLVLNVLPNMLKRVK